MVYSLLRNTPDCHIILFDNSDRLPFGELDGVEVIDNTAGQVLDFNEFLSRYPRKMYTTNNWGSAKHCYTVDYLVRTISGGFVLADSDILFKKDISDLFDDRFLFVGEVRERQKDRCNRVPRLLPFLCWINTDLCQKNGIRYFDGNRSWKLKLTPPDKWYDTGASFLEDSLKSGLLVRYVNINDYMIHFYGGSYKNKDWKAWLEENKELYE